ncbi:MAG: hypothetical protein Q9159_000527 [Coniocarpon cinnabarinum]
MWLSRWRTELPVEVTVLASLCIAPLIARVDAINFPSAPPANLDISKLGSVSLAGNFDSLSLYKYLGQDEDGLSNTGQSLLARYPDGGFGELVPTDGMLFDMCTFQNQILIAGNFTSVGRQPATPATGAALVDPESRRVTPLPGLDGQVTSVLCQDDTVYFGGLFTAGNVSNAISWTTNWTSLPFAGFNGPVNSIQQLPNGHIVYGGSFTGLGNGTIGAPKTPDAQVVNIGSANISSYPNTTTHTESSDPRNIICRTDAQSGNDWLLADNQPGFWRADFGFPFTPTKLRLLNSQTPDYATQTWRYTFYPTSGIANFTYYNASGVQFCDRECPLPQGNGTYQDFYFVNPIEMYGMRIDISAYYGSGGGLGGLQLFQDQIYSYAIQEFNEPRCDDVSNGSNATSSAQDWIRIYPPDNSTQYLSTYAIGGTGTGQDLPTVQFMPDLKQSGNYSIQVWTPGCIQDGSCASRGTVNITGEVTSGQGSNGNVSKEITQTNNYDKYDEVYYGYVDTTSGFRPTITLSPSANQGPNLVTVASRVGFVLKNSTSGLNGLYEYDPTQATPGSGNQDSPIDQAGTSLSDNAEVLTLAVVDGDTYVAGNFSTPDFTNVMVIQNGNATSLAGRGLNQAVQIIYQDGNQNGANLYIGGNFTNTIDNANPALQNIALYNTGSRTWQPIGGGVSGMVYSIVPLNINISSSEQEPAVAFSGYFNSTLPFDNNPAVPVENVAIWVPSRKNWLQNLGTSSIALSGQLTSQTGNDSNQVWGGAVDTQTLRVSGISGMQSSQSSFSLQQLPIRIQPEQTSPQSGIQRRASSQQPVQGVATGLYYGDNHLNITVIGGHFTAQLPNGTTIENLALINGSNNNQVTGIAGDGSADAAVLAVGYQGTSLFAGGSIENGLIEYDFVAGEPSSTQPPPLQGSNVVVEAIATQSSSSLVYFGGSFSSAGTGNLPCDGLCVWDNSARQWNSPQSGIEAGSIVNALEWGSQTRLFMAGNFTLNGNRSTMAVYDSKAQTYNTFQGSDNPDNVPGPITAFSATDNSYTSFYAAGVGANGSAFVTKFTSGSGFPNPAQGTWTPVISSQTFGVATEIQGVQVMPAQSDNPEQVLMLTGLLQITGFGNASAAIYDGSTFAPFALSTMEDGTPGTLRQVFVQNQANLLKSPSSNRLAVGFIVLIALAISLALILLIVVAGILAERIRRQREGYVPAPTAIPSYEKNGGNVGNISPERLFDGVGSGGAGRL